MNDMQNIKKNVLERIESGQVRMRPRWHFVLKSILAVTGMLVMFIGLLYLLSFIVFVLKQNGLLFVPIFGFRGIMTFLFASPWFLILLTLVFIIVLEVLVRKYSFGYRKPLLFMILAIVATSLFGTYVIAQTGLHERLGERAQREAGLPVMGPMYRNYGMHKPRDIHAGTIIEIKENALILLNEREEELTVRITEETRLPFGATFKEGESVLVLGKRVGNEVTALGIRTLPPDVRGPMRASGGEAMSPRPEVRGMWKHMNLK